MPVAGISSTVFVCLEKALLLNVAVYVVFPFLVLVAAVVTLLVVFTVSVSVLLQTEQVCFAVQLLVPDQV